MKNGNGLGSIFKLKGKRRKPWVFKISYRDDEGVLRRKIIDYFATKKEALELQLNYTKNPLAYSGKTFKEIKELWWRDYKDNSTSESTVNTYKYRLKYLEPLNNYRISEIKPFLIQEIFNDIDKSWSFKNGCKSLLNMIFDFALKNDFINSNKVKYLKLGKKEKIIERKLFTKEEINALWQNVYSGTYHSQFIYIILILIYTGLRIGELIDLKNNNIDLLNKTLKVTDSKTPNGIRIVPIASNIFNLFKGNIKYNQKYFLKGDTTEQLSYSTFKPRFQKICKELNLQEHTIHDTRHTFATMLNNAEANSTSIIKLVGHSDFKTTENIYTHKDTEELRKAVEKIV